MKNALIAPMQPVESGFRVAEVSEQTFEIAEPLFWTVCDDFVVADEYWFDPTDQSIKPVPNQLKPMIVQPLQTGADNL
jgi:hypothetical protein